VLIVVTRRIGDVLLATPVARSLKAAWPDTQVHMLVFAGTEGFLAGNRDIGEVITVPERPGMLEHAQLLTSLARRYDIALSLLPGDRSTLYAFVAGKRRAGLLLGTHKHRWKRWLLNDWALFDETGTHTVRMHLALLRTLGIAPIAEVSARWTPEEAQLATASLAPLGSARYAVLHPYPKFRYKMWTEAGWRAVADWLREQGVHVVLTGGAAPDERAYVQRIAACIPDALDLTGQLSLGAVARVISGAAVYVGPDTAVTHAAAALGIPTVALFGPSNPVKWGPWPARQNALANPWQIRGTQSAGNVRLVQGAGQCVPCGFEGCERHVESSSDCLTSLAPAIVIDAIRSVIN
jgi:heptosyltransferase-3